MRLGGRFDVGQSFLLKRQAIFFYIKIIVTLTILWVLTHNAQLKFELFSHILNQPILMLAAIGLLYLTVLANTWRWYRLNSTQGITLSFTQSIAPTYVGIAFNNILPGSVGGDFVRCYFA